MDIEHIEHERPYLFALAYRLLGSAADAEDVLQEAFLRARDVSDVRSPRALLTTIVTRLCLDEVRSARRQREQYVGPWLPEPIPTSEPDGAERIENVSSLSIAFLLMLEALSPLERAVFVLREVLELDFSEIAEVIGRSQDACRQALHRARQNVARAREQHAHAAPPPEAARALTYSFMQAIASGDLARVTQLFTSDVVAITDHGGKAKAARRELRTPDPVARFLVGLWRKYSRLPWEVTLAWLNEAPALLMIEAGRVATAVLPEIIQDLSGADGARSARVAALRLIRNPDKLRGLTAAWSAGRLSYVT